MKKRNIDKLKAIAEKFEVITVRHHSHVLRPDMDRHENYPNPNYLGQRKALCGILHNQTLDQFRASWVERKAVQP